MRVASAPKYATAELPYEYLFFLRVALVEIARLHMH
jgi:hypothetical protein